MTGAWSLPLLVAAVLLAIACGAHQADATYGVDVSSSVSTAGWSCLRQQGFSFGIVRAYQSFGQPDSRAAATVANAWAGGMAHVDVYMFPCPRCGKSAATQIDELVHYLRTNGVKYGMVWLDIEGAGYWRDQGFNRGFLSEAINRALGYGLHLGVYTSASQWEPIMGNWAGAARFPLWYAHYDNSPSFSDFRSFGGWTRPAIKQYVGDTSVCGIGIDKNWYP